MKNTLGIILTEPGDNSDLAPLLSKRSIGTLPFGGRYRLIDFSLSNMVNSGIAKVGVFGSNKYSSIVDHLGTGKEWMLSRKTNDLAILTGSVSTRIGETLKVNMLDFINNVPYFEKFRGDKVVIANSNLVTSYDFNVPDEIFEKNDADIVLIYRKDESRFKSTSVDMYLSLDGYRVVGMEPSADRQSDNKYTDMMIMKKSVLLNLIDASKKTEEWDMMHIIRDNLDTLKVYGVLHKGYINRVINVEKYFQANMDLLDVKILDELFMEGRPIYTKTKDNHPTLYSKDAKVDSCIVGSGCEIEGELDHSIVFREATAGKGTVIKNSILMQKCEVGANCVLDHVIFDKDVKIRDNANLIGTEENPVILSKATII